MLWFSSRSEYRHSSSSTHGAKRAQGALERQLKISFIAPNASERQQARDLSPRGFNLRPLIKRIFSRHHGAFTAFAGAVAVVTGPSGRARFGAGWRDSPESSSSSSISPLSSDARMSRASITSISMESICFFIASNLACGHTHPYMRTRAHTHQTSAPWWKCLDPSNHSLLVPHVTQRTSKITNIIVLHSSLSPLDVTLMP